MKQKTRPEEGSWEELHWLRGFEAGVIQTRADAVNLADECKRLREALEFHERQWTALTVTGLDPMEYVADGGVTAWDVIREQAKDYAARAKKARGETP